MSLPVVAVVGRPNVGKSTLVNRIVGRREAIVEESPGVTRDRRQFEADWIGKRFLLLDTGGWEVSPGEELTAGIRAQAEAAIGAADAVLFVVDATTGVAEDDAGVADLLRGAPCEVIVVANKVDAAAREAGVPELWKLGLGEPMAVSALHGRGVGELLDRLVAALPEVEEAEEVEVPRLAIVGRPNVGKSTLLNRLAGEARVLVSPVPGTTRDPIDVTVELDGDRYCLVDTAGIRRAPRIKEDADYYSVLRAREAIARSDVALLLLDAAEGITQGDQRIAELAADSGAGLILLLNKWDLVDEEQRLLVERGLGERLGFVGWAPVLRISALTGARLQRLPAALDMVLENRNQRIPTGPLNRLVREWQEAHPAPIRRGKRPRVLYAVQAGVAPPTIVLFISGGRLSDDYLRYLENRLREEIDLTGTPVRLRGRQRKGTKRRG